MRHIPQLKLVREEQGWSQRDLAARSGVAQNTISQLERGERQAMPSTVSKLAEALGVEPAVLLGDALTSRELEVAKLLAQGYSNRQIAAELSTSVNTVRQHFRRLVTKLGNVAAEDSPQREDLRNRGSYPSRQPRATSDFMELSTEYYREEALVRKEWYETGRWAEYYVSGELVNRARAFAEAHGMASILSDVSGGYMLDFLADPERQYLDNIRNALRSYKGDLVAVRGRLFSNDPKETVLAAQLVLDRAKRIVEEHEGYLQSFRRVPERYYEEPEAYSRILKLDEALSKQRHAAAEDIRKLMDLYDESLDALEDQILGMRKESDVLEEFVTQVHDWER